MVLLKEFSVGEVFEFYNGRGLTSDEIIKNEGKTAVIQGGSQNNGALGYISNEYLKEKDYIVIEEPFFITLARVGSSGYVTLQNKPCAIGDKAKALVIHEESQRHNKEVYLYLLSCLSKFQQFYSYDNGVSTNVYRAHILKLPVQTLSDTEPDWAYMENYTKKIEKKAILNIKEFVQKSRTQSNSMNTH